MPKPPAWHTNAFPSSNQEAVMSDFTCPDCLDPERVIPISRETTAVFKTGSWSSVRPRFSEKISPCRAACPIGNNISAALQAAAKGDFDAALAAFLEETPLPGICGRVCYHPCQDVCNRRQTDGELQIRALERAAADYGRAIPQPLTDAGGNSPVAVVGSGPAGLSCAYHLARMGHPVTVFESADVPGGLLTRGIPSFRLPKDLVTRELSRIWDLGVTLKTGTPIDPVGLKELLQTFSAVFLAPGADAHQSLNIPGELMKGVVPGIDFLRSTALQQKARGMNVIVVGGGNTAMDAARTALRAGAGRVSVVYRRTLDEMPAFAEEVKQAEAEGICFKTLVAPTSFLGTERVKAVRLMPMQLSGIGEDGRYRPVPSEKNPIELACDMAVIAAGQQPAGLFMDNLFQWVNGRIQVDAGQQTSRPGIYAGGDISPVKASVVDAMATGKRAALRIHLATVDRLVEGVESEVTLGEGPAFSLTAAFQTQKRWQPDQVARPDGITLTMAPQQSPQPLPHIDARRVVQTGEEVVRGYPIESATQEAKRCLVCGTCVGCNRCLVFCPEGAVIPPINTGDAYLYQDEYCKGCGVCASVCLRGVMEPGGVK
jgi:heterodisulfide reductase subunit A